MALGVFAFLIGLGTAAVGAYVGFVSNAMMIRLPAGLPDAAPETIAICMFVVGAITMLLGAISMVRSNEYA